MALLVALFVAVPIVELYVIIEVGGAIGIAPTLGLLLATALLGSLLLRQQGRDVWQRFNAALAARRFPGREVADGLMIAIGGALLLTPGFITDIVGLLLLIPPTRAIGRRLLSGFVARRFFVVGGAAGTAYRTASGTERRQEPTGAGESPRRDYDIDGTAEELNPDDPQLRG